MGTVTKESFVQFVYPFLFAPADFQRLVNATDNAAWINEGKGHRIWKRACFPEDDLLPHVARFLNACECNPSGSQASGTATAHLWTMQQESLDSTNWGLGAKAEWAVQLPRGRTIQFEWRSVELALFRLGTGFLTVEARPRQGDVDSWVDFAHYFRFFDGKRAPALSARRRTGPSDWIPFFPAVAGGTNQDASRTGHAGSILHGILSSTSLEGEVKKAWWRDVFVPGQMIPHLCMVVDDAPEDASGQSLLLYQVRSLFHSNQTLHPSDEDLNPAHASLLPYARQQWFFFSLDGGGYLALNPPPEEFFRKTMPDHVRKQYFLLFLISANQRFTLVSLQQEIADKWLAERAANRATTFERIYEHLLEFEARVYFAQVMQRDHHHRCYRKCQDIFQIAQLHEELSGEVERMYERISLERAEHMQRKIDLLTFMIGLPALMFGFISAPWDSLHVSWIGRILALIGLIALGGVLVILVRVADVSRHRYRRDMTTSLRHQGRAS